MPKVKKASPKKASKGTITKNQQKKSVPNKKEETSLHQAFVKSLSALERHWVKKTATLKKQLDALRAKHDKMALKQKAAKGKKSGASMRVSKETGALQASQADLSQAREALAQAKSDASKYTTLRKMVEQFERDWLKQQLTAQATVSEKKSKKASPQTTEAKKRGRKPKAKATPRVEEEILAEESVETKASPKNGKKRGRKAKNKNIEPQALDLQDEDLLPLNSEDEILEEIADEMDEAFEDASDEDIFLSLEDDPASTLEAVENSSTALIDDDAFEDYSS